MEGFFAGEGVRAGATLPASPISPMHNGGCAHKLGLLLAAMAPTLRSVASRRWRTTLCTQAAGTSLRLLPRRPSQLAGRQVCACMRACACVCACSRVRVRACVRACVLLQRHRTKPWHGHLRRQQPAGRWGGWQWPQRVGGRQCGHRGEPAPARILMREEEAWLADAQCVL